MKANVTVNLNPDVCTYTEEKTKPLSIWGGRGGYMKAQYGILRFAKYKGPEIGHIEAHNERNKEKYASNPDIDTSRTHLNFHLITPKRKYRAEAEKQIAEVGCKTRTDSGRVVEALFTASPEFFKGKRQSEIREYFIEALKFMEEHQSKDTIISAVVHMDERTPHMHLCFVPLTEDKRLCAKEILDNKKKLTWWQDEYWKHMVEKYPELERGESASRTGRDHIPPRVFKEMTRLTKQREKLEELLEGMNPFNAKGRAAEIGKVLDAYIPAVEKMQTQLDKYQVTFTRTATENKKLQLIMLRCALRIFMNGDIIDTQRVMRSGGMLMDDNKMRAIREETGMNRREFCERFDIPYRTVTDWELGNRHAPEYVLRLLEYYIRSEKICKKETKKP